MRLDTVRALNQFPELNGPVPRGYVSCCVEGVDINRQNLYFPLVALGASGLLAGASVSVRKFDLGKHVEKELAYS